MMFDVCISRPTTHLDEALLENGRLKLLPAAEYTRFGFEELRLWCHYKARYGIPTIELIQWLKHEIGTQSALEIGSGNGDLSYHLNIRGSDSFCQTKIAWVAERYRLLQQPATTPGPEIEDLEASVAIAKYQPQVVVASWVTQYSEAVIPQSSAVGIKESEILQAGVTYIHIGHHRVHGLKQILGRPHEVFQPPWLVSRLGVGGDNVIYIWRNK